MCLTIREGLSQCQTLRMIENLLVEKNIAMLSQSIDGHKLQNIKGGFRNAEELFPEIKRLVCSDMMLGVASEYLLGKPNFVRVIVFDKTPTNNWLVAWHQDKTVAVSEKIEIDGWGPWSIKGGTWHAQPPLEFLDDTIAIRLHLDETTISNGCLRVIPGSHKLGLLATKEVSHHVSSLTPVDVEARIGDALVMRPHLVHSSSKSEYPSNRRVIHVEYSGYQLPDELSWA